MAKKKGKGSRKKKGGSMSNMRSGFKGMFKAGKSGKADPQQFLYILAALFVFGALLFFGTR